MRIACHGFVLLLSFWRGFLDCIFQVCQVRRDSRPFFTCLRATFTQRRAKNMKRWCALPSWALPCVLLFCPRSPAIILDTLWRGIPSETSSMPHQGACHSSWTPSELQRDNKLRGRPKSADGSGCPGDVQFGQLKFFFFFFVCVVE